MGGGNVVAMFGRVIGTLAVLAFVLAACGKRELGGDPPIGGLGGGTKVGQDGGAGGAMSAPGAGGQGGAAATVGSGGVPRVPSGCILNATGTPVPVVDVLDPGPLKVACQGIARSPAVIRIGDESGQGFDWDAAILSSRGSLEPDIAGGSACPGYGQTSVGFIAEFPDNASAGDLDYGYLVISTTDPGLPTVMAEVIAMVVPTKFELSVVDGTVPPGPPSDPLVVDFGTVPVGGAGDAYVLARNLGTAPLMVIHPASPLSDPFWFRDWASTGEDAPPVPPVAPGQVATVHFTFLPTSAGTHSAELDLTPFRSTPGAGCGSPVHVVLKGSATAAP